MLQLCQKIPITISFVAYVFDVTFPIYFGYLKAILQYWIILFAGLLQLESIWFRYWTEFKWKHVKPIDDRFVITFLVMTNSLVAFGLSSIGAIVSGGSLPITFGIVSQFDRMVNMNNENGIFVKRYVPIAYMGNN